jgi:hypothetical protein
MSLTLAFLFAGLSMDFRPPMADVAKPNDRITTRDATLDPTDRNGLAAVTFHPAPLPSLVVQPPASWIDHWPGRKNGNLWVTVQNGMPWPVTLIVDVAAGNQHLKSTLALPPGPPQHLRMPLFATSPRGYGMHVGPPMPFTEVSEVAKDKTSNEIVATTTEGAIDPQKITSVTFSMPQPGADQTLLFGKLIIVGDSNDLANAYKGIVDRYGQFTRSTWPEKIDTDAALKKKANAAPPVSTPAGLDQYGGRTDLPALKASGFFRVQKQGERWWLVSPEGHPFFSLGVNAVNHTDGRTYVEGREFMFLDPAAANGPFGGTSDSRSDNGSQRDNGMNHGRWWDVYANNIARTLGNNFDNAWRKRTLDRLKAWRFNTLGNWSDPGFAGDKRMAYTVPILIHGDFNTVSTGYDYWGRMPDPFDPRFEKAAQQAVANATKDKANDPWLLGYFADNELAWAGQGPQGRWALAVGSLAQGPQSPAKQAFIAYLKKTHGDAATFAKAWGLNNFTDWKQLEATGFKAPDPSEAHPAVAADYIAFLKRFAGQYFNTVAQTLKKADPHHLFLGGRLAVRTPEVEEMSAKYTDVTSINTYTDLPEHGFDVAEFKKWDKPVMITEFHFGSNDRGPFGNGVAAVANEAERGKAYTRFVDAAAASGVIVGTHWFQYVDQPVTGRILDGENSHIGLVGITDIPFEGFTRAVTETNARVGGGSGGGSQR